MVHYEEMIQRAKKVSNLLHASNWRWDINKSGKPRYYLDSQGLEDAVCIVENFISPIKGTTVTLELDHNDKKKKLVVISFIQSLENYITTRETLVSLVQNRGVPNNLYVSYVTRIEACDPKKWCAYLAVPNALFCDMPFDDRDELIKKQAKYILPVLQRELGVPEEGRLYLIHDNGCKLVWHSCPACNKSPSVFEKLTGFSIARHLCVWNAC